MPERDEKCRSMLVFVWRPQSFAGTNLPVLFREIARITKGRFFYDYSGESAAGPQFMWDDVKAAKTYRQDNASGRLEIEFQGW